jgi:hypothetical protein
MGPRDCCALDMVPGDYQHNPVQNNWHIGSIKTDGTGLRWTNKAGASWRLIPDLANQRQMAQSQLQVSQIDQINNSAAWFCGILPLWRLS